MQASPLSPRERVLAWWMYLLAALLCVLCLALLAVVALHRQRKARIKVHTMQVRSSGNPLGSWCSTQLCAQKAEAEALQAPEGRVCMVFTDIENSTKLWAK